MDHVHHGLNLQRKSYKLEDMYLKQEKDRSTSESRARTSSASVPLKREVAGSVAAAAGGSTLVETPSAYTKADKSVNNQSRGKQIKGKGQDSLVLEIRAVETTARPSPAPAPQSSKQTAAAGS